jgi:hypothetical protein
VYVSAARQEETYHGTNSSMGVQKAADVAELKDPKENESLWLSARWAYLRTPTPKEKATSIDAGGV